MRGHDWASTPLGPAALWPEALKVPLRMMLTSRFEMWLGWGPDLAVFYNDAYAPTLGIKHPGALGRPLRQVWPEIFETLEGRFNSVMRDGAATWDKALMLMLERSGYPEETYHTFSYSPLISGPGHVGGLMCVVTEETERVLSERRLETLRVLATSLLTVRSRQDIIAGVRDALWTNRQDFPFSVVRLFDGPEPRRTAESEDVERAIWPIDRVRGRTGPLQVPLAGLIRDPPKGVWDVPPRDAMIVPIAKTGQSEPSGALILGLNPYRPVDAHILDFAELLAGQVAGALATVDAQSQAASEMERLRQLFEQSPSFMAVLRGPEHRFELTNPSYSQIVAHRDVLGKTVLAALPEVESQGFVPLLDRVYATGETYVGRSAPLAIQRAPGAEPVTRFLDFVYQPIRNAEGVVTGVFVEGIDVTATHDAVAALRESEAQFRTFAQAMPNQVWTSPPSGELDWFNEQVFAYSGLNFDALSGRGWTRIVHPDDLPGAGEAWRRSLATGDNYEFEFRLRRADGVYLWHLARALPIRDAAGGLVRWIGTNTDIHERKLSEAEHVKDRDRIWRLSPVLKVIGSITGELQAVNPAWTNSLGWTAEETIGHNVMEFVAPEDVEAGAAGMAQLGNGIPVVEFQITFIAKTGQRRRISWTTVPEDGRLYGFGRDVTAETVAAEALAASTAERDRIWNSTNDLMGTVGFDGFIKTVNPAWSRLLGHGDAELLSRPFLDIADPADHEKLQDVGARLAGGQVVAGFESSLIHKDGARSLVGWSAERYGEEFYIVGRNITAQRAAEEALRQSQKMEAVGQLTGGIAHDFNNLLQGITGSLDLVQKRVSQGRLGDLDRFIAGAMTSANRADTPSARLFPPAAARSAHRPRQPADRLYGRSAAPHVGGAGRAGAGACRWAMADLMRPEPA